jgi:hypothetical protein
MRRTPVNFIYSILYLYTVLYFTAAQRMFRVCAVAGEIV